METVLKTNTHKTVRIAYVVNRFDTGGVKSLLMNYFRYIDHEKFEIDFLICGGALGRSDLLEIEERGGRVVVLRSPSNPVGYVYDCMQALQDGRYDIVQACMNSMNVLPLLAAKMSGVPVRISYNLSTSHPGERNTVIKAIFRKFGNAFTTGRTANSQLAWDWLFKEDGRVDRVIIPNPINLDVFHFDAELRASVRVEMGWNGCFVIGHIGRFEYQKNHRFLLKVFEETLRREPNARLALVGYGSSKEGFFADVNRSGLSDFVCDLGATEDISGLYNAFDCFVLPSFYEGFPVVALEAQATGCPCVFSTEVTKEAGVIEQVKFLSLSESPSRWADTVLGFKSSQRQDGSAMVMQQGYEVEEAARELEQYYLRSLRIL